MITVMDSEQQALLERILELEEANNKMLRKMRNSQRISSILSFMYWLFIVGGAAATYYYVAPKVQMLLSVYQDILVKAQKVQGVDTSALEGVIKDIQGLLPKN